MDLRRVCLLLGMALCLTAVSAQERSPQPFGADFPNLDDNATGDWWVPKAAERGPNRGQLQDPPLLVPRDEVMAFAVYTQHRGTLKLTAQLYPLKPDEPRTVTLEFQREGEWQKAAESPVMYPGWSAHFRVDNWDAAESVPYRVRLADQSSFEGTIRRDPADRNEIVVASLSCNSRRTPGPRTQIIDNLLKQDPDLLFFAGDQSYHHTQHTFGWLEFGIQFRDVMRDRPVVTIPDDHDVGQGNIWGQGGRKASSPAGSDGGFFYPAAYVNMVQRCQTWHLPDAFDPEPIDRGITVYFTSLTVGGVDFAILEDRKFKSGPEGKIPKMGPRPDHINDPTYDRKSIDVPGLELLGERQIRFLDHWAADWTDASMKCVLSQTAFCGAVHLHGSPDNRLLADLDCNGWPQSGRKTALTAIRRAWAPHLCGDQHLAVVVQHGIDRHRDGPFGFTNPAIVNTIYGRWWHPEGEQPGANPVPDSPLPWTGDYEDGLGNAITMLAYANPPDRNDERLRADGYGIARFNKSERTITFECWPRFCDVTKGNDEQFPGWPVTIAMQDNDGRQPIGWLPEIHITGADTAVVQVVHEETGEVLYTVRTPGRVFRPPVYSDGHYTIKAGTNQPDQHSHPSLEPSSRDDVTRIEIEL